MWLRQNNAKKLINLDKYYSIEVISTGINNGIKYVIQWHELRAYYDKKGNYNVLFKNKDKSKVDGYLNLLIWSLEQGESKLITMKENKE